MFAVGHVTPTFGAIQGIGLALDLQQERVDGFVVALEDEAAHAAQRLGLKHPPVPSLAPVTGISFVLVL